MHKDFNGDAFEVDNIRHVLAREGDLHALSESYQNSTYPEMPDLSSAQLWDSLAEGKDIPEFRSRRLSAVARRVPFGARVLDVGIGWGEIIPMILSRGNSSYTGVDFSEKIVAEVSKKFPKCNLIVGGLEGVSGLFDVVMALEVCEHILPRNIFSFFAQLKCVLAEDGRLIVTVPVYENLRAMTLRCPSCGHFHNRMGHVRAYSPELIKAELRLAGFEVLESFFIYANFKNSIAGDIKRWIVDIGRRLLGFGKTMPLNVVVVARKLIEKK